MSLNFLVESETFLLFMVRKQNVNVSLLPGFCRLLLFSLFAGNACE